MRAQDLGTAFELRRGEVERVSGAGSQYFHVRGFIEANGSGESIVNVIFPCLFIDKPRWSFGPELGPGQPYVPGNLPIGNLTVVQWGEHVRDDGTIVYAGAAFGVVALGPPNQVMVIQWNMEGLGLRGPIPSS